MKNKQTNQQTNSNVYQETNSIKQLLSLPGEMTHTGNVSHPLAYACKKHSHCEL